MVSESGMEANGNWHAGSSWLQKQRPESGDALHFPPQPSDPGGGWGRRPMRLGERQCLSEKRVNFLFWRQ